MFNLRCVQTEHRTSRVVSNSKRFIVATLTATTLITSFAAAQDCPNVKLPAEVNKDTQKCLNKLQRDFDSDVDVHQLRQSLLWKYDDADQLLVIELIYSKYCKLLTDQGSKLSSSELEQRLKKAKSELYQKGSIGPQVFNTKDIAGLPLNFAFARAPGMSPVGRSTLLVGFTVAQTDSRATSPNRSSEYLRESPFVVNNNNKYFVIVGSPTSETAAIEEAKRLKSKAPQYDFVVYAPYRGSRYYAIMMATWVSKEVAYEARKDARRDVVRDAYIWKCPQDGEIGTC